MKPTDSIEKAREELSSIREPLEALFGLAYGGPSRKARILTPKGIPEAFGVHVYIEDNFSISEFREAYVTRRTINDPVLSEWSVKPQTITITDSTTGDYYQETDIAPGHFILIAEVRKLEPHTPEALRRACEHALDHVRAEWVLLTQYGSAELFVLGDCDPLSHADIERIRSNAEAAGYGITHITMDRDPAMQSSSMSYHFTFTTLLGPLTF